MFNVQLQGTLALAEGRIAEMQTGEGKTLAAVPAAAWLARSRRGVHVMTVNDYLARRDAAWMGGVYRMLGLSVGCVQQGMAASERKAAYACDVTYSTANEVGFDFLRDQAALSVDEQVHRPFHAALIDEVDSILIDEARIPLVLAGGAENEEHTAERANRVARWMRRHVHFNLDEFGRNISLTDEGARVAENDCWTAAISTPRKNSLSSTPHAHRRHPRAQPAAPRRGLRGDRQRHRVGGRV